MIPTPSADVLVVTVVILEQNPEVPDCLALHEATSGCSSSVCREFRNWEVAGSSSAQYRVWSDSRRGDVHLLGTAKVTLNKAQTPDCPGALLCGCSITLTYLPTNACPWVLYFLPTFVQTV